MDRGADPVRVMLVDDSVLFREGLAGLLATTDIRVVEQASRVDEALVRLERINVDVVVLDIRMPPSFTDEGLRAARELRRRAPTVGLLLLSAHVELASAARLFDDIDHSVGYLLKDRVENVASLVQNLHQIAEGEMVLDPEIVQGIFRHRRNVSRLQAVSEREREVLQLMAEGRSNAGIAGALHLSAKTVETHVAAVLTKLGLPLSADDNRRVLAVLAWLRTQRG